MSLVNVTFADPERAVVSILDAAMSEAVNTWFPKSSTDQPPSLPFVQVGWDGTPDDSYPVTEEAEIRVTFWSTTGHYSDAKSGAARARGILLAYLGDAAVWRIRPGIGRLPGSDPDTKLPFCTFTVRVSTRPVAVV